MKIAIEGCAHGELEKIYDSIQLLEEKENVKVDLLICCGDFQSTRNLEDLRCMAIPPKYYNICTFYKYYNGEKTVPILTVFIGGNHEASNYLQELSYGGWVAPNIYYLGYAGVINIAGIRIAGISGIYKSHDYQKGRYEIAPYEESTKRSVYHIRNIDIFRLKQLSQPVDICLSHDWPNHITKYGNVEQLLKKKSFFQQDIESDSLGSPPCQDLLNHLKPNYWFSAHLHCKFAAVVPHYDEENQLKSTTKFLALDKCLPRRNFLQLVDIPHDETLPIEIQHDLEWITVLHLTNHLINVKNAMQYMPGPNGGERWIYTPTNQEKELVLKKFSGNLTVPQNFVPTAPSFDPEHQEKNIQQPEGQTNPQTITFCDTLGIDDPTNLILLISGKNNTPKSLSFHFAPKSVEIKHSQKLNLSLPEPSKEKLNLTLPAPKNNIEELDTSLNEEEIIIVKEKLSLSLPAPKISDSSLDSTLETDLETSGLSTSGIFVDLQINASTPQRKKFKRRNESIYNNLEDI